ncbi:ATP-dependent DNA helicase RecG [uncultured Oscillibacter sp.]|uniref:ATP-dependent DNA helicase RecG n=1 Tax=uncultured Oscillibacter sp. TaxID=876091 RepID=UPI0025FF19D4|nr:ATP-dependent DNA helicase RecG [uncultured Oscillibacter sp.]
MGNRRSPKSLVFSARPDYNTEGRRARKGGTAMADLRTDVRYIKGIGEQRAKALAKLGIRTLRDLISWFPRRYEDRTEVRRIADLVPEETACVAAMVAAPPTLSHIRRGLDLVKLRAVDETGALDVTFFNQAWLKNSLREGETYIFCGKAEGGPLRRRMANPIVEPEGRREATGRIVPVYPLTAGVSQLLLSRSVRQGLDACADILPDVLPDEVRQEHQLCRVGFAYENIHFPESAEALELARRRLAFEELFLFTLGLRRLRQRRETVEAEPFRETDMGAFYRALPFTLTEAQRRCIEEALADMASGRPMNRLCQGDVGSGKTMVAAACVYACVKNGRQAALMAPTEILARQHHAGLRPLLEPLGIRCALLTGASAAKEKKALAAQLAAGEIDLVVGTHALISGGVEYRSLGLVVTDEQHRFGVSQRAALAGKGDHPHTLVMSATPIPRTLALILYGDLDISVIDQLPPGRRPVQTSFVDSSYHPRIYRFLRRLVGEGRQVYIVCPQVSESEEPGDDRKAVTEYAAQLSREVFPDLRVAFVHGKMKPKEKDAVMTAFAAGEADILVSTTVIEVGVDVPNAAVMVVENAERFGLSQLHQLRGRVGRGSWQSYCVLVSDNRSEETRRRLKIMTKTADGFRIAEEDLRLRGPGDFFGQRQHGLPGLRVADIGCDALLLREAQEAADALLARDPELRGCPATAERMAELFTEAADTLN